METNWKEVAAGLSTDLIKEKEGAKGLRQVVFEESEKFHWQEFLFGVFIGAMTLWYIIAIRGI